MTVVTQTSNKISDSTSTTNGWVDAALTDGRLGAEKAHPRRCPNRCGRRLRRSASGVECHD